MKLLIFRHGKTYYSARNIGYGDAVETAEILPEGKEALQKLGSYLKNIETDFNVSSPFLRCRQTVEIVGKESNKNFVFDDNLRDIDYRIEREKEVAERITEFYNKLISMDPKLNSAAICTHGYPIAMLRMLATTGIIDLSKLDDYPNTGVLTTIEDGKVIYKDFN